MNTKRLIGISIIILILALCVGAAGAADSSKTNATAEKTFSDVTKMVDNANPNDEIILDGTYVSQGKEIEVTKNLTFKGKNSATLDGKKTSRIITTDKDLTFTDITFKNAFSREDGGAIKSTGKLTFKNCNFISNNIKPQSGAISSGSAVYCTGKMTIKGCTFQNNAGCSAVYGSNANIKNSKFIENTADYAVDGTTVTISNCEFSKNVAAVGCCAKITDSKFDKNNWAIYCEDMDGIINVDGCNFTNNAEGAIYTLSKLSALNSQFISNRMGISAYTGSRESYEIPNPNPCTVSNCIFKSNRATAISTANNLIVKNSTFENNRGSLAGAIYSDNYYGGNIISISDSTFTKNTADYAGAIKAEGAKVTITNTKFQSNTPSSIVLTSIKASHEAMPYEATGNLKVNSKTFTKSVNLNDNLKSMEIVKVTANKVKTTYFSGKKLVIKLVNKFTGKPLKYSTFSLKVFTGSKYKTYELQTNKKGVAKFKASVMSLGYHKVEISSDFDICRISKTTTGIKVFKAKTIVKAPNVTSRHGKTKYFKIKVLNNASKKVIKKLQLKVKIGKKLYTVKTNTKGIAKISIKHLKPAKYRVFIKSANGNYRASARSMITIR